METAFAYLKVIDVREWNGRTIASAGFDYPSKEVAIKEGFQSIDEFTFAYWELNESCWDDPKRKHWFIEFRLAEDDEVLNDGDEVLCKKCRTCVTFKHNGRHREFAGDPCDGRDFELRYRKN